MKDLLLFLAGLDGVVLVMNLARGEFEIALFNAITVAITLFSWRLWL